MNLNSSIPVNTFISASNYESVGAPGMQWRNTGAFWTDKNLTTLYSVGGYDDGFNNTARNTITSYNASSQAWSNVSVAGGNFNFGARNAAVPARSTTSGQALGFLTGGPDDPSRGLLRFDGSDSSSLTWRNETNAPHLFGATMQYVRFGNKGMLVAFGGYLDVSPDENALTSPTDDV